MQLNLPALLTQFRNLLQGELFPVIESSVGPLSKHGRLLVGALSLAPIASFTGQLAPTGRPRQDRQCRATAFLAKAIYNLTTTRQLLDRLRGDAQLRRLCGWETITAIPAESTFSPAFAEFSSTGLPSHIHAAVIRRTQQNRTFSYLTRDSTAIEAREHLPQDKQPSPSGKTETKHRRKSKSESTSKNRPRRPFGSNRRESKPYAPTAGPNSPHAGPASNANIT